MKNSIIGKSILAITPFVLWAIGYIAQEKDAINKGMARGGSITSISLFLWIIFGVIATIDFIKNVKTFKKSEAIKDMMPVASYLLGIFLFFVVVYAYANYSILK